MGLGISAFYSTVNSEGRMGGNSPKRRGRRKVEENPTFCYRYLAVDSFSWLLVLFYSGLILPTYFAQNACHYRLGGRKEECLLIQPKWEAVSCAKTGHLPALASRTKPFDQIRSDWPTECKTPGAMHCTQRGRNRPHPASRVTSLPCDIFRVCHPALHSEKMKILPSEGDYLCTQYPWTSSLVRYLISS